MAIVLTYLNSEQLARLHGAFKETLLPTIADVTEADPTCKAINVVVLEGLTHHSVNKLVEVLNEQWKGGFIDLLSLSGALQNVRQIAKQVAHVLSEYYGEVHDLYRRMQGSTIDPEDRATWELMPNITRIFGKNYNIEGAPQSFGTWISSGHDLFSKEVDQWLRMHMLDATYSAFIPPPNSPIAKHEFIINEHIALPRRVWVFQDQESYEFTLAWATLFCMLVRVQYLLPESETD